MSVSIPFPFSAIVGQSQLKTALLISIIDSKIGGVLISGSRGSAKSTVVRSLTALNMSQELVTLPLGATEEMLIGSVNLEAALKSGDVKFSPGLLAKANNGLLYVDEVNLLPDHLVDLLLDVAVTGLNTVERDGVSHTHDAHFILIGTMNPDEGELRPQLLDRFGLMVHAQTEFSIVERQQIVKRRLEFDQFPEKFVDRYRADLEEVKQSLSWAINHLEEVIVPEDVEQSIAQRCADAKVDGFRADITLYRAARAYAALNRCLEVSKDDVDQVEEMVFCHRRNHPFNTPPPADSSPQPEPDGSDSNTSSGSSIQGSWGMMEPQVTVIGTTLRLQKKSEKDWSAAQLTGKSLPPGVTNSKGKNPGRVLVTGSGDSRYRKKVHWFRTLIASENIDSFRHRGRRSKLRFSHPKLQSSQLDLILLDTSASTLENQGISKAKGLIKGISTQSYLFRRRLSLVTFGNDKVGTILSPQRAPKHIDSILNRITSGGGTPLAKALDYVSNLLTKQDFRAFECHVFVLTDGRVEWSGAHHDISRLHKLTVMDIESGSVKLGQSKGLANKLGADYLHIDSL